VYLKRKILTTCAIIAAELAIAQITGEVEVIMMQPPGSRLRPHSSRPNYLAEVTMALIYIWQNRASGRLSIRNGDRFGLAHLYFREACLIHVAGDKGDGEAVLNELSTWLKGSVRFDEAMTVNYESVNWQQAEIFRRWLAFLEMRGSLHETPGTQLGGLVQDLTARLPKQPIVLPEVVEHYDEYDALDRQRQRLSERVDRVNRLIGRTEQLIKQSFTSEHNQQFVQSARRTVESIGQTVSDIMDALPRPPTLTPEPIRPPLSKGDIRER
jgi:hypothetical protein